MLGFKKRPTFGPMAVRDRFMDIRGIVKSDSPVIVDGGANQGNITDIFLRQYPSPTIHLFEPIPELGEALRSKYQGRKNILVHQSALGPKRGTVTFNVVNNLVSSSILTPTGTNLGYHGRMMEINRAIYVPQVGLDEILDRDVDILKLDLQGYEMEALKGCERLINRIKVITTEIEFVPLYEGQPLFAEIDLYLRSRGFKLLNLYELYTHPDGQLTAGDAVYLNTRYF